MTTTLPAPRTPDPMSAPPLRWGVLGSGFIAGSFVDALHKFTRQRVVAVGSRTAAKGADFAARHGVERSVVGYEALVADPEVDVVYVATPHSEHRDNALLAIAAGKHVLVEKAFTRNLSEATEVVDAARAAGVTAMEAMWTRFLPHIDIVRQLLADGALGEIETVFADHGQWFEKDPDFRLFDPAKAGGAMLDLGVYPVSFAHFALGAPGSALAAGTTAFTGVDRQISAVLTGFQAHPAAHAVLTTTLAARTPTTACVAGDAARVEIPGWFYAPQQITLTTRDGEVTTSGKSPYFEHEGLCLQAAHFASLVAEGRTESDLLPLDETLAVMATMDELRRQVGVSLPGETL